MTRRPAHPSPIRTAPPGYRVDTTRPALTLAELRHPSPATVAWLKSLDLRPVVEAARVAVAA